VIAFPQFIPLVRVGGLPPAPCDEQWLRRCLDEAAVSAGRGEFWATGDIARGVLQYLETHCHGSVIDLPALIGKLRAVLECLGCGDIAGHLDAAPPPMPVPLAGLASDAGNGFELLFFEMLGRELVVLAGSGVREVRLEGLRDCVLQLRGGARWRRDCEQLACDIRAFVRGHGLQALEA
jgi:hypothetical protein